MTRKEKLIRKIEKIEWITTNTLVKVSYLEFPELLPERPIWIKDEETAETVCEKALAAIKEVIDEEASR